MKGRTLIELQDKDGRLVEYKDDNMLTNAFTDMLNIVANTSTTGALLTTERDRLNALSNNFIGIFDKNNLKKWGIRIFSEPLEENADKYNIYAPHLAYGNETTSMEEGKGVFNDLSSKFLTNDIGEVVGIRLVWDFATNIANGEIACVCLTPTKNTFGSLYANHYCKNTSVTSEQKGALNFFYNVSTSNIMTYNPKRNFSYRKNGMPIAVTNNTVKIYQTTQPIVSHTGWLENDESYTEYTIEGYEDLFKVYDLDHSYVTLGKNTQTENYDLIRLNHNTLEIEETLEVGELSIMYDYLIVGENEGRSLSDLTSLVYFTESFLGSYTYTESINLKTMVKKGKNYSSESNANYHNTSMNVVLDENNNLIGKLFIERANSNWGRYESHYYKSSSSETGYDIISSISTNGGVSNGSQEVSYANLHFGLTPICVTKTTIGARYHNLAFDNQTVFTINNLETPVTKTDANTMKITYELTWGEVAPN